jgi:hypothetical protein
MSGVPITGSLRQPTTVSKPFLSFPWIALKSFAHRFAQWNIRSRPDAQTLRTAKVLNAVKFPDPKELETPHFTEMFEWMFVRHISATPELAGAKLASKPQVVIENKGSPIEPARGRFEVRLSRTGRSEMIATGEISFIYSSNISLTPPATGESTPRIFYLTGLQLDDIAVRNA